MVDNSTDSLSSIGPGVPELPEIFFLLSSIPPSRQHDGHDRITVFDQMCVACHGYRYLSPASVAARFALRCSMSGDMVTSGSIMRAGSISI